MRPTTLAAAAALFAIAGAAQAEPCKGAGSTSAKPIFYYTADDAMLDGLDLTLVMGLQPGSDPLADIAERTNACARTTFAASGHTWTLYGDDGDRSPRWTRAPDDKTIFYVASMPAPDQVHAWAQAQRQHPTNEPSATFKTTIWVLVAADGDQRTVFGFYDQVPDDARLILAMQAAIGERTPAVLGFNVKSAKTDESRIFQPITLAVAESKHAARPVDKAGPDGVAFENASYGAVRALVSGLRCPLALGADLQRYSLFTTGADDGSREAGCRYVGERARLTVVVSRARDGDSVKDLAALVLPPMVPPPRWRKGPPPPLPGPGGWGEAGTAAFVHTLDDARQGAVLLKRGGWFVEVYALYGPEEDRAINGALDALAAANPPQSVGSGPPIKGGAPLAP